MQRVDAHQHFWKYDPAGYGWMTDEMTVIKRDFQPPDLLPEMIAHNMDATVLVQVRQNEQETEEMLALAHQYDFIKGVVGWIDLRSKDIRQQLDAYSRYPALKGFRHILQAEQPEFMLQPEFLNGVSALKEFDFTYDILIYPQHLDAAIRFASHFPQQRLVIDHLAKPEIRSGTIKDWERKMRLLAQHENISCKISGMITEADWENWTPDQFTPYIDVILNAFGINRVMFGSDWPMCLVAGAYSQVIDIVEKYFSSFSDEQRNLVFGQNAIGFYKLQ